MLGDINIITKQVITIPLLKYLLSHEEDIALSINDFGDLKETFELVFDRKPKDHASKL